MQFHDYLADKLNLADNIYTFLLQYSFECRTFTWSIFTVWYRYFYFSKGLLNSKIVQKHTQLPLHTHIQMWMVILEYWVSLSRDKSDRLICPVRGWRVIGHIWPPALWTVGTRALSNSGNWLMKHFRNSSTRLSSTGWDWVRHECVCVCLCVWVWPAQVAKRHVCAGKSVCVWEV